MYYIDAWAHTHYMRVMVHLETETTRSRDGYRFARVVAVASLSGLIESGMRVLLCVARSVYYYYAAGETNEREDDDAAGAMMMRMTVFILAFMRSDFLHVYVCYVQETRVSVSHDCAE